ncbi:MAG: efflux RND transporter periplasmic adaptor subunit [Gammaproteobacteria bacterium]
MKPTYLLLTLALLGNLAACSQGQSNSTAVSATAPATTEVRSAELTDHVITPGTVVGSEHAELASRNGGRVARAPVQAGARVERGALLLEVAPEAGEATLAEASARATAAQAEADQAARDFARYRALYVEKAVSPHEFEQMRQRRDVTAAAAQAAARARVAAQSELGYALIRAPFAGVVAAKNVRAGDYAAPGVTLLVLDGGRAQVETRVGEALLATIHVDQAVTVTVDGEPYHAQVIERVSAADPVTRTHLVKLELPRDAEVASGAYASVAFPLAAHPALLVPTTALVQRAGLDGVFVVNAEGVAAFRLVRPGATRAGATEILAGLAAGERVVTAPGPLFDNGTHVTPGGAHD